jgi:hypothetical protein
MQNGKYLLRQGHLSKENNTAALPDSLSGAHSAFMRSCAVWDLEKISGSS